MKKNSTNVVIEAFALKLCPPDSKAENCQYGLPLFAVDRVSAIQQAAQMLSHCNIKPDVAVIAYVGTYDVNAGRFASPAKGREWSAPLINALVEVHNEKK